MIRAFAALALPAAHQDRLGSYAERCAAVAPGFRWVAAPALHLTLRFAGNLPDELAASLAARLREVRHETFNARLGGLGTFGGRRPRVVWVALAEGVAEAGELAEACERACRDVGLEPEPRPFRAHVTLARARDQRGAPLPELPPAPELPSWRVEEFVLFRSVLHGGRPPEYEALERYPLG